MLLGRQTARGPPYISLNLINSYKTVETSCTINQQQIQSMKSKHCDRPTCDKLCAPSYDALTVVGVVNKLDRRRRKRDRLAVAKFSKCRVSDKVLEGIIPQLLEKPEFLYNTACDRSKDVLTPNKKLCYRRRTARRDVSDEFLPIVAQLCRNNLYDKTKTNWSNGVRGLQSTNV